MGAALCAAIAFIAVYRRRQRDRRNTDGASAATAVTQPMKPRVPSMTAQHQTHAGTITTQPQHVAWAPATDAMEPQQLDHAQGSSGSFKPYSRSPSPRRRSSLHDELPPVADVTKAAEAVRLIRSASPMGASGKPMEPTVAELTKLSQELSQLYANKPSKVSTPRTPLPASDPFLDDSETSSDDDTGRRSQNRRGGTALLLRERDGSMRILDGVTIGTGGLKLVRPTSYRASPGNDGWDEVSVEPIAVAEPAHATLPIQRTVSRRTRRSRPHRRQSDSSEDRPLSPTNNNTRRALLRLPELHRSVSPAKEYSEAFARRYSPEPLRARRSTRSESSSSDDNATSARHTRRVSVRRKASKKLSRRVGRRRAGVAESTRRLLGEPSDADTLSYA